MGWVFSAPRSDLLAFAQYLNLAFSAAINCSKSFAPASEFIGVMLNVTGSTLPSDVQWLAVIVVMPVGSWVTTIFTWLNDRESLAGFDPSQNLESILWIACVSDSASFSNCVGVSLIVGSAKSDTPNDNPSGSAFLTASSRAKATAGFCGDEF